MEIWQYLLLVLVLIVAYPLGLLLSKLTDDELKDGNLWFRILISIAGAIIVLSFCLKSCIEDFLIISASMLFIIIISAISIIEGNKLSKVKKKARIRKKIIIKRPRKRKK